jgi:hypothetical protein
MRYRHAWGIFRTVFFGGETVRASTFIAAAIVGLSPISAIAVAQATTVTFSVMNGATDIADGSFSYATGSTGVLNYSNLTAFSLQFHDGTNSLYNLAFATSQPQLYFAYDTSANDFVTGSVGGFPDALSANNNAFTTGYFFNPTSLSFADYQAPLIGAYTVIDFSGGSSGPSATPLPAALPLFAGGLGAMGLFGVRRKRKAAANAARRLIRSPSVATKVAAGAPEFFRLDLPFTD